jgi:NADH dehydrogenase FAD-containing subunit
MTCIGQMSPKPVSLLSTLDPSATKLPIPIKKSLQIQHPEGYPNIFVVGDAAHTPAAKSARTVSAQVEAATRNIVKMIKGEEPDVEYQPTPPGIHMSFGVVSLLSSVI